MINTYSKSVITVSCNCLAKIRDFLNQNKKIAAIKELRGHVKLNGGQILPLRDAKHAVERLHDAMMDITPTSDPRPVITANIILKEMKIDFGGGDIVVDLEELQFKALTGLTTLGFEEAGRILDLVEVLKAWSNGYNIGVINKPLKKEEEEEDSYEWV